MVGTLAMIGILAAIPPNTSVSSSQDDFLQLVHQLKDDEAALRAQPAKRLTAMGPDVLELFFTHFTELDGVVRNRFATEVIPHLGDERVKKQLLVELRNGATIARRASRLRRGEKVEGFGTTHASMEAFQEASTRWHWTLYALEATAIPEAYSELYVLYQQMKGESGVDYKLARALYKSDPDRAVRDLEAMLRDASVERRLQGLGLYRHLAPLIPDCNLLRTLYDESPEVRAAIAGLLRHAPPRECLDLLLDLCTHPDAPIRNIVDESLCSLAHISRARLQTVMQGATDPAARAMVWRGWWEDNGRLSNEELRLRGCQETFRIAEAKLGPEVFESLGDCADRPETYKILEKAVVSENRSVQTGAHMCLDRLVHFGNLMAVEFLLEFCATHDVEESGQFGWRLSRLKHERAVPTLIDMLERGKKSGGEHALAALGGLKGSRDPLAFEPIRELLADQPCLASWLVGSEFPKQARAESIVPNLLHAVIEESSSDCRRWLRLLIREIGGTQLPERLLRVLPDAPAGDRCQRGSIVDILELMEEFPDPAAGPLLLEVLKSENPYSRLHAARVLGRLGDAAGVPLLLEDLFLDAFPIFDHHERVGEALRAIASPKTPPQLLELYTRCDESKRKRVLEVIGLQDDPAYLAFWEPLLDQADQDLLEVATHGVVRVVWKRGRAIKTNHVVPGDKLHDSLLLLMRWAFRAEMPTPRDQRFAEPEEVAEVSRALVQTTSWQFLLYDVSEDKLRQLEYGNPADIRFIKDASNRSRDVAFGGAECRELGDYVVVNLNLLQPDVFYLFRNRNGLWRPVGRVTDFSE